VVDGKVDSFSHPVRQLKGFKNPYSDLFEGNNRGRREKRKVDLYRGYEKCTHITKHEMDSGKNIKNLS